MSPSSERAGSRDRNHPYHCSRICCMSAAEQTHYVVDAYDDAQVTIYYIDIRADDRSRGLLPDGQGDGQRSSLVEGRQS